MLGQKVKRTVENWITTPVEWFEQCEEVVVHYREVFSLLTACVLFCSKLSPWLRALIPALYVGGRVTEFAAGRSKFTSCLSLSCRPETRWINNNFYFPSAAPRPMPVLWDLITGYSNNRKHIQGTTIYVYQLSSINDLNTTAFLIFISCPGDGSNQEMYESLAILVSTNVPI